MRKFLLGMGYLRRGARLIRAQRSLWPWVLAPATLTAALASIGAIVGWRWGRELVQDWLGPRGGLVGALLSLVLLLLMLGIAYVLYVVVSLVAVAPFAGILASRTERLAGVPTRAPGSMSARLGALFSAPFEVTLGLSVYLAIVLPLLALPWLLPPAAPLCLALGLLATAIFFARDATDPALAQRSLSWRGRWAFLWSHRAEVLGLGLSVAFLCAVPGLNLLVQPVAVVAGTLLVVDQEKQHGITSAACPPPPSA